MEKLTAITSEEYNESEEGIGYLAKSTTFPTASRDACRGDGGHHDLLN